MLYLHRTIATFACAGLLALVLGCGPGGPKLYPTKGTLKIDGSPANYVTVELHPVDNAENPVATGVIQDDGNFEVFSGKEGESGAAAGTYKVVLRQRQSREDAEKAIAEQAAAAAGATTQPSGPPPAPTPTFHSKYSQLNTSDKEVTIEKKSNTLSLEVEGPEA